MANIVQDYYSNVATKTPVPATLGIARIAPQNADAKLFITNAAATALYTFDAVGSTFSARSAGGQTATNNTWTKVQCNNVSAPGWNIDGYYNTTLYRFLPLRRGYYNVTWLCAATVTGVISLTNVTTIQAAIYRNGTSYRVLSHDFAPSTNGGVQVTALIPFNGTSDYVEPWGYISIGGGFGTAQFAVSYFEAVYIRGL